MKYYLSNQNGDWWTLDTETGEGSTLSIISEVDLAQAVALENPEMSEIDLTNTDKLEQVITQYGKSVDLSVN